MYGNNLVRVWPFQIYNFVSYLRLIFVKLTSEIRRDVIALIENYSNSRGPLLI